MTVSESVRRYHARSMRRAFLALVTMASLGVAAGGCELVFGLDDYAQGTSEATTGSTGTEVGPGSGAGSPTSTGTDSTGSKGDGGNGGDGDGDGDGDGGSSSSGGPSCPCVPEGWRLVEGRPTTLDAPVSTCPSQVAATRVNGEASVSCDCSCSVTGNLDARLGCWSEADCTGTLSIGDGGYCIDMPTAKSCQRILVQDGEQAQDICIPAGVVASTAVANPFDLCVAPPDGVGCDEEGVCGPPGEDALWCIQGPVEEACPAEWPDDYTLTEGGTPACDCTCVDAVEVRGTWSVANPSDACFNQNTDITSRVCQNVPDLTQYHGAAPLGDQTAGDCTPTANVAPGHFEDADQTRLCCRPPE
jgi:hypothetical protein